MAGKTILVLGGGTGGLVAANRLRRLLSKEHRVVLVNRTSLYSFPPSYLWVVFGKRHPGHISRDLRKLEKKGIEFIAGEVTGIDPSGKKVHLGERELEYDYLIVSLGAEYSADEIPGLGQTYTYYHLEGADGLREHLPKFSRGRLAVVISRLPYKCPAAPYEGALLMDDYFRRRKLRDGIDIHVYTPEPYPLPVAGRAAGEMVQGMLSARGIGFTPGVRLQGIDHKAHTLHFEDGSQAEADMVVATPIHKVPAFLVSAGLAREGGWVSVDRETLQTPFEGVYAIGDVAGIPLANGLMLPKAGVFAHGQAEVVARNIAALVRESDPIWAFGGQGSCFLETTAGKSAYVTGNFYAEPDPAVHFRQPSWLWHWSKAGFERVWFWRWF